MAKTKLYTFDMSLYGAPTKHVVKMASLVVTWMSSYRYTSLHLAVRLPSIYIYTLTHK